jgi:hypothetical protein
MLKIKSTGCKKILDGAEYKIKRKVPGIIYPSTLQPHDGWTLLTDIQITATSSVTTSNELQMTVAITSAFSDEFGMNADADIALEICNSPDFPVGRSEVIQTQSINSANLQPSTYVYQSPLNFTALDVNNNKYNNDRPSTLFNVADYGTYTFKSNHIYFVRLLLIFTPLNCYVMSNTASMITSMITSNDVVTSETTTAIKLNPLFAMSTSLESYIIVFDQNTDLFNNGFTLSTYEIEVFDSNNISLGRISPVSFGEGSTGLNMTLDLSLYGYNDYSIIVYKIFTDGPEVGTTPIQILAGYNDYS